MFSISFDHYYYLQQYIKNISLTYLLAWNFDFIFRIIAHLRNLSSSSSLVHLSSQFSTSGSKYQKNYSVYMKNSKTFVIGCDTLDIQWLHLPQGKYITLKNRLHTLSKPFRQILNTYFIGLKNLKDYVFHGVSNWFEFKNFGLKLLYFDQWALLIIVLCNFRVVFSNSTLS